MTSATLSLIAGTLLSLIFSYVPGARDRFDPLNPTHKRLIMLGLLMISAASVYGVSCLGWGASWGITIVCDRAGALTLLEQLILAIIANQSVYALSPRLPRIRGLRGLPRIRGLPDTQVERILDHRDSL